MGQDQFHLYFDWRSKIERDGLPEDLGQEEQNKKLRVANKLVENANISPKFQMPTSRHIQVIVKWKQLEEADKDLEAMRKNYETQIGEYSLRWREVEDRQTLLKSNLVKYNNFVKEKHGKVADGVSREILQKKKQSRLQKECKSAESDWKVLVEAKEVLEAAVDQKKLYNNYLDSVLDISEDNYPNKKQLINRCQALVETRLVPGLGS